ncbi:TPA: family 20 glycosylhydrolase [Enterococcus faecium]
MKLTDKQVANIAFIQQLEIPLTQKDEEQIDLIFTDTKANVRQIKITKNEQQRICLSYSHEDLLYRGLFICLPRFLAQGGEMPYIEETSIIETSYSLDASRNGVMNKETLKKFISYLALMGYNTLYIYTEDTYEVEDLSYFGYLRGAYTKEEVNEIVEFASGFGIEVVPSIQTLAHLTQFLKWYAQQELMDDQNTLLIGEEKVYAAIEKMIIACKEMYQTERIHLGMDEAYQAGLGRYLSLYGYCDRTTLMIQHMDRVLSIVDKYKMKPMIWSDFIYKLLDETGKDRYYNPDFKLKALAAKGLPAGLTYVHWDYGSDEVSSYEKVIDNHLKFCDIDHYVLASGAHIWGRLAPNHGKTEAIVSAAVKASKNKGVRSVMLTTWGDEGQETEHWHSLIGALKLADYVYSEEEWNDFEEIYDRLLGTGSYQLMSELRYFDEVDTITNNNLQMASVSKLLLWQDPLVGIYDFHVAAHNKIATRTIGTYYHELAQKLDMNKNWNPKQPILTTIRQRYILLAEILAQKAELGIYLQHCCLVEDLAGLMELANRCEALANRVNELASIHEIIWYQTYKTYGWEVLEQRYAALAHRLKTVARRIKNHLQGQDALEELLEERLPFCQYQVPLEISGFNYRQSSVSGYN